MSKTRHDPSPLEPNDRSEFDIDGMNKPGGERREDDAQARIARDASNHSGCDDELIHLPDAIQPHGALVVIDREARIVAAARNLEELVGVPLERALGEAASALFGERFLDAIANAPDGDRLMERGTTCLTGGKWFSFLAHQSGRLLMIELQVEAATPIPDVYRLDLASGFLNSFFNDVVCAPLSERIAQKAVRMIRDLSGFDRVLICQFDAAGDGSVLAEEKAADWTQSLVGLNFPASDIPKQARALYLRNRIRHIPDNAYVPSPIVRSSTPGLSAPIDLSLASLRSISPVHREYLDNMGVAASFSASIIVNGALWGMLIGHHRQPRHLSWERLDVIERAAELLGPRVAQSGSLDALAARLRHEEIHQRFLAQLAKSEDLFESFLHGGVRLTDLFAHCAGAAAKIGGRVILVGRTPGMQSVERLIAWLQMTVTEDVWATDCISGHIHEMLQQRAIASGVLVGFLTPSHQDLVIWFRGESEETVAWAGDPHEKRRVAGALLPRKHFERWIESKSAHSRPWGSWEPELVRRLGHSMMAVLSAQLSKLKILNAELEWALSVKERFLAQMSHELRTPLNAVIGFSDLIATGFSGPTTPKQDEYLGDILAAGKHLLSLINDILELSRLEAGKYILTPIPLDVASLATRVVEMLGPQALQQGVSLSCSTDDAADLVADQRSLTQILVNLISNAIKFTPAGGRVELEVTAEPEGVAFTVSDSGVGMDAETLDQIGEPFFQAKSAYMAPGGTGLGLSIVRALVKENGGTIAFESELGVGTTVVMRLPKEPVQTTEALDQAEWLLEK